MVITRKGDRVKKERVNGINGDVRRLDLGCEHTMQYTDNVLWNCVLETCIILFTNLMSINSVKTVVKDLYTENCKTLLPWLGSTVGWSINWYTKNVACSIANQGTYRKQPTDVSLFPLSSLNLKNISLGEDKKRHCWKKLKTQRNGKILCSRIGKISIVEMSLFSTVGVKLTFTGGHISLTDAFKGPKVILTP